MENNKKITLENINYIKGIAILGIIFVHSTQLVEGLNWQISKVSELGRMGCQVFYVITAFLAVLSWKRKRTGIKDFYIHRFVAIAPAYQFTIAFYLIFNLFLQEICRWEQIGFTQSKRILDIILNALLMNGWFDFCNNNVVPGGWYIGTLAIFILFFPILVKLIDVLYEKIKGWIFVLPLVSYIVSALGGSYLNRYLPMVTINGAEALFVGGFYNGFVNQFSCFITGMILGYQYLDGTIFEIKRVFSGCMSVIMAGITVFLYYYGNNYPFCLTNVVFSCALFAYFVIVFTMNCNYKGRVAKSIIEWGKISYAVYFVHFVVVWYLFPFVQKKIFAVDGTVFYLLMMILTIPVIYMISKLFDKWIKKIAVICESVLQSKTA